MNLLATVLSPRGLEKVQQIRQSDDDFKTNGSKRGPRGGGPPPPGAGGPPPGSGGPPSQAGQRPGGPGGRGPNGGAMFGSDLYGKTIRPIGAESDKGLALLTSLNEDQRKKAILNYRVADLVLGPGQDGKKITPEGLKATDMSEGQRAMLLDLIGEWAGIANETAANARMEQMKSDLSETWFAWSGPATAASGTNITAYYRIQGPHLVIEYAPQNDEPANHVHTIYRDPTNDYGVALTLKQ
jgi:hypothetical protein